MNCTDKPTLDVPGSCAGTPTEVSRDNGRNGGEGASAVNLGWSCDANVVFMGLPQAFDTGIGHGDVKH